MKTAIAIRHVHFEDLGTLEPLFRRRGYKIHYSNVAVQELDAWRWIKPIFWLCWVRPLGLAAKSRTPF